MVILKINSLHIRRFLQSSSLWSFVNVCSAGGGQNADHHHRHLCRRSHRSVDGLHVAEELNPLYSFQTRGEKVSFHTLVGFSSATQPFRTVSSEHILVLGSVFGQLRYCKRWGRFLTCFFRLLLLCASNAVFFPFPHTPLQ